MKLYELPRGSKFTLVPGDVSVPPESNEFDANDTFRLSNIDGMYSLCYDSKGVRHHFAAWTEVKEKK